jgi:hypothetical protein
MEKGFKTPFFSSILGTHHYQIAFAARGRKWMQSPSPDWAQKNGAADPSGSEPAPITA